MVPSIGQLINEAADLDTTYERRAEIGRAIRNRIQPMENWRGRLFGYAYPLTEKINGAQPHTRAPSALRTMVHPIVPVFRDLLCMIICGTDGNHLAVFRSMLNSWEPHGPLEQTMVVAAANVVLASEEVTVPWETPTDFFDYIWANAIGTAADHMEFQPTLIIGLTPFIMYMVHADEVNEAMVSELSEVASS